MHRRVIVLLLLLTGCRTAAPVKGLPSNFGVVEEGRIYRGAQPSTTDLEALSRLGIRTILKLNGGDLGRERADAARLGMQLVYVPLSARTVGTPGECRPVEQAYAALTNPDNWPVYVHCTHGRDRTGFLIGLFREREERWAWPEVSRELSRFGHGTFWRTVFPYISRSLSEGVPRCGEGRITRIPARVIPSEVEGSVWAGGTMRPGRIRALTPETRTERVPPLFIQRWPALPVVRVPPA